MLGPYGLASLKACSYKDALRGVATGAMGGRFGVRLWV
jgi:hypothetical protein